MKKSTYCFVLVTAMLTVLPSFSLENPYSSGGNQYGGESFPASDNSSTSQPSNSSSSVSLTASPYQTDTGSSYPSNSPAASTSSQSNTKPWNKVGGWIQKKQTRPTGQPEVDLANQRIQAGKLRIKAVKAREKLDKHIADCTKRTEELTQDLQKSEEQATLIENQVKFQEANLSK
jgi:hypothetical protein